MVKRKLDECKILLVICCRNKDVAESQVKFLAEKGLNTPDSYECSIQLVNSNKNLGAVFNEIQKSSDAKYKIYLTSPVSYVDSNLVMKLLDAFYYEPKTAMVGFLGSEMPIDGDYSKAKTFYGLYSYKDENNKIQNYIGKDFLMYKSVHMVESSIFATNEDIAWDEKVGNDFTVAAHCCNLRSRGYDIGVFYQEEPMIVFERDECSYAMKADWQEYNNQLEKFRSLYMKKIMPLVSVLIPTYNQPKFCCEALESALNQTYKNIEILIGDDSTNEDTKKAIRPYLKKYSNVKYFYHNGKIPRGGGGNMYFLINHCNGDFVNYLLHDDLFYPEKISKMMNYYVRDLDNRICLVTSARDKIDEDGKFLRRQNPWQPHKDTIIRGEEVGRRLLFILANFIGELTTVIFRKKDVAYENVRSNKSDLFSIGNFCGVSSSSYGDMDTWLNILKNDGDFVFMAESLSAFRKHVAQNTYNPQTRINIPLDALMFIVVAWLNSVFFRNVEEFNYCLDKWVIMADRWFKPIEENDSDKIKYFKNWIMKLRKVFITGNHEKMLDAAISFLLDYRPRNNQIAQHIIQNPYTKLWEKRRNLFTDIKNFDLCHNTWVTYGTPKISKSNSKQDSGLCFDRSAVYTANVVALGGKDFTIGCKVFMDSSTSRLGTIFCLRNGKFFEGGLSAGTNGIYISRSHIDENSNLRFVVADSSGKCLISEEFSDIIAVNQIHLYELDYFHDLRTLKLFVDGVCKFTKTDIEIERSEKYITLGMRPDISQFYLVGCISEFVVKDGIALHDSDFEHKPYKEDEFTKVLLNFDE